MATKAREATAAAVVRALGADDIIEFGREDVPTNLQRLTQGRRFAVVIDTVGGANLDKSLQAAATGGRVAVSAARSTHDLSPMHGKALSSHAVFMLLPMLDGHARAEHGAILRDVAALCGHGCLRPLIDPTGFALESASCSHAFVEDRRATGKVVVDIAGA